MTRRVFWEDPYRHTLSTRVAGVRGDAVTLEETIFFAESGGQESDTGTIAGLTVGEARWEGRDVVYTLPSGHGLRPGDPVTAAIDWERRYRQMRLHFASEVVLELVYRDFGPVAKTGAHIAADKARIDFAWEGSIAPILPTLGERSREIIDADLPIESAFSDADAERRYWKIDGFAQVPCGGTHLRRTGEVGPINLKRKNPGKGRERIEIRLD